MAKYNGYRNRNAWNVTLWLHNDLELYSAMQSFINDCPTRDAAAAEMTRYLAHVGLTHTRDGAPFNKTNIRIAMRFA